MGRETSLLSAAAGGPIVPLMGTAIALQMNPGRLSSALALLVAALISASAVHAAEPLAVEDTRVDSIGFAATATANTVK
jgi:hypothetical protein